MMHLFVNFVPLFGGKIDKFVILALIVFLTGGVPFCGTVINTFFVTALTFINGGHSGDIIMTDVIVLLTNDSII
jgi:hypothetical protein